MINIVTTTTCIGEGALKFPEGPQPNYARKLEYDLYRERRKEEVSVKGWWSTAIRLIWRSLV